MEDGKKTRLKEKGERLKLKMDRLGDDWVVHSNVITYRVFSVSRPDRGAS